MSFHYLKKQILCLLAIVSLTPTLVSASGYQLWEQNASGLGDDHAGGAAEAADASTAYYNPAGMVRIEKQQMVTGAVAIRSDVKFKGSLTTMTSIDGDISPDAPVYGKAQGGIFTAVPFFHYVSPINDRLKFGFSIVAPFGSETDYGEPTVIDQSATKTSLRVVDLSPNISYAITPQWAIGAGVDYEKMDGEFDTILAPGGDIRYTIENHGSDSNYGWHAGLLYQYSDNTRVGLSFHSNVRFHLEGKSKFSCGSVDGDCAYLGEQLEKTDVSGDITLPAFTELSFYHRFKDNPYAILFSVTQTQWQVFQNFTLDGVADNVEPAINSSQTLTVPNYYGNTWHYSLGFHDYLSKELMLRFGVGYDQTPSNRTWRNVRAPDQSRTSVAIGGGWQVSQKLKLDLGYSHLFIKRAELGNTIRMGTLDGYDDYLVNTTGTVRSSADLLGLQMTWNFD